MKNILIIGGSYGIGLAIAKELYSIENVIIACRSSNPLFTELGIKHIVFDALNDNFPVNELPEKIDGLVYCPGSITLKPFRGIKPEAFENDFQINFLGAVKVIQAVLPHLLASPQASIVLFSSVAAQLGMPFHTSISASKGAIEGFSKAFAAEYAPKIRINVIAPSITETPLAEKLLNNEVKKEKSTERHPLKRFGQPQDISNMASYLLSDKSSWITGQIFKIDGGMSSILKQGE
jgi:3-oxoacyl-[acyl-carrier protein] reductase